MTEDIQEGPDGIKVIKLDPEARYLVILSEDTPLEQADRFTRSMAEWWERGQPVGVILADGLKFVKVSAGTEIKPGPTVPGTKATCRRCGDLISFTGSGWEHAYAVDGRNHDAQPKQIEVD